MIVYDKELMEGSKVGCYPSIDGLYSIIPRDVRLHMERVGIYAEVFYTYLKDNYKELMAPLGDSLDGVIREIYTLHDVGRAFVPVRFQNKAEALTDEEYAQIRRHVELAPDALDSIYEPPYSDEVLMLLYNISVYHHERWDGRGYPSGIDNVRIPLEARICSLADAYDGMTSWKPYRKPMDIQKVRSIIKEEAGKQFQPELSEAFLECMHKMPDNLDASWEAKAGRYFGLEVKKGSR